MITNVNPRETTMRKGKTLAALVSALALLGTVAVAPTANAAEMTCNLVVHYPHGSNHVSGTINVEATTTCPMNMMSIKITVDLDRTSPSGASWRGTEKSVAGKNNLTGNKATSCSDGPGTFQGWAKTSIVPPAGYVLTGAGTFSRYGPALPVACGVARMMGAATPETTSYSWPLEIQMKKIAE